MKSRLARFVIFGLAVVLIVVYVVNNCGPASSVTRAREVAEWEFDYFCRDAHIPREVFRGPELNLSYPDKLAFDWVTVNHEIDSIVITIVVHKGLFSSPTTTGRGDWRLLPYGVTGRSPQQIHDSFLFLKDSLAYQDSIVRLTGQPGEFPAERKR